MLPIHAASRGLLATVRAVDDILQNFLSHSLGLNLAACQLPQLHGTAFAGKI